MKCKAMIWLLCIMVMFTACSLHDPHLPNNSEPSIATSPYSEELTEGLHIHDSDTIEDSIKIELGAQTEDSVYRAWYGELHEMLLPVGFNYDMEKLNSFDKNSEKTAYKLEYTSASFIDIDVDKRNAYYPSLFTNLTSEGVFWNLGNNSDTKISTNMQQVLP